MPWFIPALVIGLPILEIYVFVKVAGAIGFLAALGAALLAGLVGLALLRVQGFSTVMQARAALDRGELPLAAAFDGVMLAVAGLLLLLPGFLTDVLAILLLIPGVRSAIRAWLAGKGVAQAHHRAPDVIEGDFVIVDPDDRDDPRLPPRNDRR